MSIQPTSSSVPSPLAHVPDVWREEAKRQDFFEALKQNVNMLEESLQGGKTVAPEFIEILQKDVDALGAVYRERQLKPNAPEQRNLRDLNVKLGQLAAKYFDQGLPGWNEGVVVPEARPRVNIHAFELGLSPADLEELKDCSVVPVRGDGNCLFRAVAAHLLTHDHLEALKKNTGELQRMVPEGVNLHNLVEECDNLLRQNKSVDEILCTPEVSKKWVLALRGIATQWWCDKFSRSPSEVGVSTFLQALRMPSEVRREKGGVAPMAQEEDDGTLMAQYVSGMGSFDCGWWGGEQEIVALQEALEIPIRVVDVQTPLAQRRASLLPSPVDPADICLLHRPGHYDALYLERVV
jgi:hypothetical protein